MLTCIRDCIGCFATLRQMRSIRRSVSDSVFTSLVVSLIMPRLHYGNATLAGLPEHQRRRLKSVLNAAARLIYRTSRCQHVTPLVRELHWLRRCGPESCRLRTCRPHFPLPPWSGATLLNRRHTSCRRHQSPVSALVFVSSTDCWTNAAGDHGRPRLSGCRQPTLEQSTARHHLCSHTPCFLHPSKDIYFSVLPLVIPN